MPDFIMNTDGLTSYLINNVFTHQFFNEYNLRQIDNYSNINHKVVSYKCDISGTDYIKFVFRLENSILYIDVDQVVKTDFDEYLKVLNLIDKNLIASVRTEIRNTMERM